MSKRLLRESSICQTQDFVHSLMLSGPVSGWNNREIPVVQGNVLNVFVFRVGIIYILGT